MSFKPGDSLAFHLYTFSSTGAATNADSTPTALFKRNGTTDAAVTVTVASTGTTGEYKASCTIPGTYVKGDVVEVTLAATVSGVTGRDAKGPWVLDSKRNGDLVDYAGTDTSGTTTLLTRLSSTRAGYLDNLSGGAVALASGVTLTSGERISTAGAVRTELATELGRIDAAVSSRMASFTYTAPDNTSIAAIKAKTDNLPAAPAAVGDLSGLATSSGLTTVQTNIIAALPDDAPTAAEVATAVDTLLSTNHGEGSWEAGEGGGSDGLTGARSVTLTFQDADGETVPQVSFTVVGQGSMRAGTDGVAAFGLDDGTYTIVAAATAGTLFPSASLTVNGTETLTITGTARTIPVPSSPELGVAYGDCVLPTGAVAAGVTITFTRTSGQAALAGSAVLKHEAVTVTTDEDGHFEQELVRATYTVKALALHLDGQTFDLEESFDLGSLVE